VGWAGAERPPVPLTDGLKTYCVQMKSTEIKALWQLVKAGEKRPLSAADLGLLLRIRFALQEYDASEVEREVGRLPSLCSRPASVEREQLEGDK